MAYRKPRTTQRPRHDHSSGHVARSPTGHDPHRHAPVALAAHPSGNHEIPHFGPRKNREMLRLTNITDERARTNPHRLSKRMTKFITNMHGQVNVPNDVVGRRGTVVPGGTKCLDIYEIPED
jgi:hypothetical protein